MDEKGRAPPAYDRQHRDVRTNLAIHAPKDTQADAGGQGGGARGGGKRPVDPQPLIAILLIITPRHSHCHHWRGSGVGAAAAAFGGGGGGEEEDADDGGVEGAEGLVGGDGLVEDGQGDVGPGDAVRRLCWSCCVCGGGG